jgi:hypothetical protein
MKPIIYNGGDILQDHLMDFDISVEIHVVRFGSNSHPQHLYIHGQKLNPAYMYMHEANCFIPGAFKVLLIREPVICDMRETNHNIVKFAKFYDLIITTDQSIINNTTNSKLFLCGTTTYNHNPEFSNVLGEIAPYFNGFDLPKENSVSFLKTHKSPESALKVPGYSIRNSLWEKRNKIEKEKKFYVSSRAIKYNYFGQLDRVYGPQEGDIVLPNDDKLELFKSKFSIIIENSADMNYFSEKLIDCLLAKTIPLYWGCNNISDFFDKSGIISFYTIDELIQIINEIDFEKYYNSHLDAVEKNFHLAKPYAYNYSKRVEGIIKQTILEKINAHNDNLQNI